ncbi:MAG TPA: protein kinase [Gemmatimonadales bacterium]|nr:protein kinase [Gemmatimonadales bacterium]
MTDSLHAQLQAGLSGQYTLERELGRGGMATVFLAQDQKHRRPVALKVLLPELAASLGADRFHREIEVAARLQHPHILTVHDSGQTAGQLWFTMPYVEGQSLRDRLTRERQLQVDDALRIAREAAAALDYAHEHGVVHRDVKPENILLTRRGDVLVADFGIARALGGSPAEALTQTGMAVGTPAYMSPEQAAGDAIDGRSDIYSLGCVLYEMLAGEPPYTGVSAQAIMAKRFSDPVPSVRRVRPVVPEAVDYAIQRALAQIPADRFGTAIELAQALQVPAITPVAVPTVATPVPGSAPPSIATPPGAAAAAPMPTASNPAAPAPMPTAAPRRTRPRIPIAAAMLALGFAIGLGVLFAWRRSRGAADDAAGRPKRLAVLPFENQGDSADAYFADGITDELRGKLAAVPGLEVVAGRSSNEYRHSAKELPEIARDLGVDYLLVGTIRWERGGVAGGNGGAGRVRVSPELIKVASGSSPTTKWAEPFDAALTDVFQVQADIAGRVTQSLNVALGSGAAARESARPTTSTEAYDYYLRGNEYFERQRMADIELAADLYRRALGADSSFALAWARLARADAFTYWFGNDRSAAHAARIEREARRALALGPDLPEAHVAMGFFHYWGQLDYAAALDEFAAASRLEPNNADAAYAAGLVQRRQGKWEQAVASFTHATALDPRSVDDLFDLASTYFMMRAYADAERVLERAAELAPDSPDVYALRMAVAVNWKGDIGKARDLMREGLGRFEFARFAATKSYGDCFDLLAADDAYQADVARLTPAAFSGVPVFYFGFKSTVHYRRGELAVARAYADSARTEALATIQRHEENVFVYTTLSQAYAVLGQGKDAIAAAERALALLPPSKDAVYGQEGHVVLAWAYMLQGNRAAAVEQLRGVLAAPSYLSAARLRADPLWAPLKDTPGFEQLVAVR